jgi:hypothetical protein
MLVNSQTGKAPHILPGQADKAESPKVGQIRLKLLVCMAETVIIIFI